MAENAVPTWVSLLLIALTVCSMAYTAFWVERRFGPDKRTMRKAWFKYGSLAGAAVLTFDCIAVAAIVRWA